MDMHVGSEALQGMEHMLQVFLCRSGLFGLSRFVGSITDLKFSNVG